MLCIPVPPFAFQSAPHFRCLSLLSLSLSLGIYPIPDTNHIHIYIYICICICICAHLYAVYYAVYAVSWLRV